MPHHPRRGQRRLRGFHLHPRCPPEEAARQPRVLTGPYNISGGTAGLKGSPPEGLELPLLNRQPAAAPQPPGCPRGTPESPRVTWTGRPKVSQWLSRDASAGRTSCIRTEFASRLQDVFWKVRRVQLPSFRRLLFQTTGAHRSYALVGAASVVELSGDGRGGCALSFATFARPEWLFEPAPG